jgi:hypothetical protein
MIIYLIKYYNVIWEGKWLYGKNWRWLAHVAQWSLEALSHHLMYTGGSNIKGLNRECMFATREQLLSRLFIFAEHHATLFSYEIDQLRSTLNGKTLSSMAVCIGIVFLMQKRIPSW